MGLRVPYQSVRNRLLASQDPYAALGLQDPLAGVGTVLAPPAQTVQLPLNVPGGRIIGEKPKTKPVAAKQPPPNQVTPTKSPIGPQPSPVVQPPKKPEPKVKKLDLDQDRELGRTVRKTQEFKEPNFLSNFASQALPHVDEQVARIEAQQQALMARGGGGGGVDISTPIANYVDFLQTGKLGTREVKPVKTIYDAVAKLEAEKQDVLKQKSDLIKAIVKPDEVTKEELREVLNKTQRQVETGGAGGGDLKSARFKDAMIKDIKDDFDEQTKDEYKSRNQASRVSRLIREGGPASINAMDFINPKFLGEVGNLAQTEQQKVRGNPTWIAQLNRFVAKGTKGTLTPTDAHDLLQLVDVMQQTSNDIIEDAAQKNISRGHLRITTSGLQTSPEEVRGLLGVDASKALYVPETRAAKAKATEEMKKPTQPSARREKMKDIDKQIEEQKKLLGIK